MQREKEARELAQAQEAQLQQPGEPTPVYFSSPRLYSRPGCVHARGR